MHSGISKIIVSFVMLINWKMLIQWVNACPLWWSLWYVCLLRLYFLAWHIVPCRNVYGENRSQYVLFQKLCNLPLNYVGKWGRIEMFILRCTVMVLSAGISNCLTPEYILWWKQLSISFFLPSELSCLLNPDDKR